MRLVKTRKKRIFPDNGRGETSPMDAVTSSQPSSARAQVIVVGNEKGGSGKSTTTVHLIASLLHDGYSVACADLDFRQGSLTRFLEYRNARMAADGISLPMPDVRGFAPSALGTMATSLGAELSRFDTFMASLRLNVEYVILDTPGNDTVLSAHAHSYADVLITPLNDSFIDLDVIARLSPDDLSFHRPGHYTEQVEKQRLVRAARDNGTIDWIVMRNRLGALQTNNMRAMDKVMKDLSRRLNFRTIPGFGERIIFRELYPKGLTLLDIAAPRGDVRKTMSHVAARQEMRALLKAIGLPSGAKRARRAA